MGGGAGLGWTPGGCAGLSRPLVDLWKTRSCLWTTVVTKAAIVSSRNFSTSLDRSPEQVHYGDVARRAPTAPELGRSSYGGGERLCSADAPRTPGHDRS